MKRQINVGEFDDAELDSAATESEIHTGINVTYIGYIE